MISKRIERLNSLLKEVISDIIRKEVRNPHINGLITVTRVSITNDLHHAKVYVSIMAPDVQKQETLMALKSASGFIATNSSKQVVMRYFPELTFKLDDSVDKHLRIESLLHEINLERKSRTDADETDEADEVDEAEEIDDANEVKDESST